MSPVEATFKIEHEDKNHRRNQFQNNPLFTSLAHFRAKNVNFNFNNKSVTVTQNPRT